MSASTALNGVERTQWSEFVSLTVKYWKKNPLYLLRSSYLSWNRLSLSREDFMLLSMLNAKQILSDPLLPLCTAPEPLQNLCWQYRDVFSWCAKTFWKSQAWTVLTAPFQVLGIQAHPERKEAGLHGVCLPLQEKRMGRGSKPWALLGTPFTKGWKLITYSLVSCWDGAFQWCLCLRV